MRTELDKTVIYLLILLESNHVLGRTTIFEAKEWDMAEDGAEEGCVKIKT